MSTTKYKTAKAITLEGLAELLEKIDNESAARWIEIIYVGTFVEDLTQYYHALYTERSALEPPNFLSG